MEEWHGKKPYVEERNRKKKLQFAKAHISKEFEFWKDVSFTDESQFKLFGSGGRTKVWRRPIEELKRENLQPTMKHGGSVMVWGCISDNGVSNLHFVDGNMDQFQFIDILKKNLRPSAIKLGIDETYKVYQDNGPKHKFMKYQIVDPI